MDQSAIQQLLEQVRDGRVSIPQALKHLRHLPFEDLGFAKLDHHRNLRQGFAEVIYARGKTPNQVAEIVSRMLRPKSKHNILITRASPAIFRAVRRKTKQAHYHALSTAITIRRNTRQTGKGKILILTAGTTDIPVAEEAALTAQIMGNEVETIYDVGVAGLHRLLHHHETLLAARVIVCAAGMEGALPSVVAGLVSAPVIAVPTSVGYGTNFGGLTALLAMLNSCAPNVTVVNIDNGFSAGYAASLINAL